MKTRGPSVAVAAAATLIALSSCSRVREYGRIAEGNRLHDRGRYDEAVAVYVSVREASFGATVDYNLANAYARLGEYEAAARLYDRARISALPGLEAEADYNKGVALFEAGRYEEAWLAFRASITAQLREPRDEAFEETAGRALELAWRAWKKRELSPPESVAPSGRSKGDRDEGELRLFSRFETGRWKPGSPSRPDSGGEDY